MPPDYVALYSQLGRLLENAPDLADDDVRTSHEAARWLGRAYALISAVNASVLDAPAFQHKTQALGTMGWQSASREIFAICYRALAVCELAVPAAAQDAFIPVGSAFDALKAISKIFGSATGDVLVVDPYLDEVVLNEFGHSVPDGISFRLLADQRSVKPSLAPAVRAWVAQFGASRPLEVRLAAQGTLHDRAIFVDSKTAWTITQSFNAFAKRAPAEIIRADDTANLKIDAYGRIWAASGALP